VAPGGRISTTNEHGDARTSATTPSPRTGGGEGRRVVLVADDEALLRRSITLMLKSAGFDTIEATDGAHAVEVVRTRGAEISVVLLDVSMPLMSGVDAAVAIRRLRNDLPIVMMTGGIQDDIVGVEVVMKPFDAEVLLAILHRVTSVPEISATTR
jgi:DNA-binding response OmpR family regulator